MPNDLNKGVLNELAQQAIAEGGYDCEVFAIFRLENGIDWCIDFTNKYGRLCDSFNDTEKGGYMPPSYVKASIADYLKRNHEVIQSLPPEE